MDLTTFDWFRIMRPQGDGYDTQAVAELAAERYGFERNRPEVSGPVMFGRVPLVRPHEQATEHAPSARFDHPNIGKAEALLWDAWPEMYAQCADLLTEVWPLRFGDYLEDDESDRGAGCSCGNTTIFGGVSSTINGVLGFAEGIVHELGHWKMHAMGVHLEDWDDQLVGNPFDELFVSSIRKDTARPMGACIQAHYSYLHVTELNIRYTKHTGKLAGMLDINRDRMIVGRETLQQWRPGKLVAAPTAIQAIEAWTVELIEAASALLPPKL